MMVVVQERLLRSGPPGRAVGLIEHSTQWQGNLGLVRDPVKLQLATQAGVIAGFKQAWAQLSMYLDRCSDSLFAHSIGGMLDESHGPPRRTGT
jgi:hypothetical protein